MKKEAKIVPELEHERFLSKIKCFQSKECWEWTAGFGNHGYGRFNVKGQTFLAHRISYTIFKGQIGNGLVIDHTCMNRKCVNPDHLRQVTRRVNNIENSFSQCAENAVKTHCKRGHEFTIENTKLDRRGDRECRQCRKMHDKMSNQRARDRKSDK